MKRGSSSVCRVKTKIQARGIESNVASQFSMIASVDGAVFHYEEVLLQDGYIA
jgi:hypothetical protein